MLADRQSFYLENPGELELAEVAEEFIAPVLRGRARRSRRRSSSRREVDDASARRRGARRAARRPASRCAPPSAATSAGSSTWPSATRGSRSTRSGSRPSARASSASRRSTSCSAALGARRAAAADRVLRHLEPDGHAHRRLDGRLRGRRAEEERLPALHDPRRSRRACPTTSPRCARSSTRRLANWERQQDLSPHDPACNESFATLPNLIVIDGGKGQLAAGARACCRASASAAWRSISLAKRIEEVFVPGRAAADRARPRHAGAPAAAARARRGAPLRDHPPPHAARPRDDGVGARRPARASGRRASARCSTHFGSPEAVLAASRRGARGRAGPAGEGRARSARVPAAPERLSPFGRASTLALDAPRTHYARNGDVNIAYQVAGEGPIDLVFVPGFISHLDLDWERPASRASRSGSARSRG